MNVTFTPEQVTVVRAKVADALHNLNSMTAVPGFRSAAHHVARAELLQSILDGPVRRARIEREARSFGT